MNLYTSIRALLVADATTNAIVTYGGVTHIYRSWQAGYKNPAIVIQDDGDEPQNDLSGHSGFTVSECAVVCRGDNSSVVDSLKDAVKAVLAGYSGSGSGAFDLVIDNIASSVTPKQEGSDQHWFDWIIRCTVLVSETI